MFYAHAKYSVLNLDADWYDLGATAFVQSIRSINGMSLDKMLGGMFTGMVWGMVISVGIYRLFFITKDRLEFESA